MSNTTNPFAVGKKGYTLAHQPKSFDWREKGASSHPWNSAPKEVVESVCVLLDQIITLTK